MFDVVERIRADQRELASESRAGWPVAALSQRVVDLAGIAERNEADLMCALGQWDAQGCWAEDGALNGASWLAQHTPMSRAKARRLLRAARLLREHEATAAALASGAVSSVQVDSIATITRNREDLYADGEDALLTAAEVLTADGFTVAARYWRACADDAAASEGPRSPSTSAGTSTCPRRCSVPSGSTASSTSTAVRRSWRRSPRSALPAPTTTARAGSATPTRSCRWRRCRWAARRRTRRRASAPTWSSASRSSRNPFPPSSTTSDRSHG